MVSFLSCSFKTYQSSYILMMTTMRRTPVVMVIAMVAKMSMVMVTKVDNDNKNL